MKDSDKTQQQLMSELAQMQQRITELEALEIERRQAQEALRESEREKTTILNAISDIVAFQDRSLSYLWVNEIAGRLLGKRPEELVGQHCYELWHGRSQPCENCPVLRSM